MQYTLQGKKVITKDFQYLQINSNDVFFFNQSESTTLIFQYMGNLKPFSFHNEQT